MESLLYALSCSWYFCTLIIIESCETEFASNNCGDPHEHNIEVAEPVPSNTSTTVPADIYDTEPTDTHVDVNAEGECTCICTSTTKHLSTTLYGTNSLWNPIIVQGYIEVYTCP